MESLKNDHVRTSTRKNYYCVWKQFNEFVIRLDSKPTCWEDRLTLFVTYLVHNQYKSQTVKSYILAIRGVLKDNYIHLSEDRVLLSALTRACKLRNDFIQPQLPIKKGMLAIIVEKTFDHFNSINQPYLAKLYATMFATMYFGLLRVGEVASGDHPVKVRDVHVGNNKQKILFILRTSKTHNKGTNLQMIKISSKRNVPNPAKLKAKEICPYSLLWKFILVRPGYRSVMQPFFIFRDHQVIKPRHVQTTL